MTEERNKPVAELIDRDIKIAIWKNPRKDGQGFRYSGGAPVRSYKDEQGVWHESTYFGFDEYLRIQRLAGKAADMIEGFYKAGRS